MAFDTTKSDSQATDVQPIAAEKFDFDSYNEYEHSLLKTTGEFFNAQSGVLVYRRMRAAEVFSYSCRDMRRSLEVQLGCLAESMKFKADVPNFLEPWYGIGTTASAYGIDYAWGAGLAPAVHASFATLADALQYEPTPIAKTEIGQHTLRMIEYFLEHTRGRLPMSYCDAQSPLNAATMIAENTDILLNLLLAPDDVKRFFNTLADLSIDFVRKQQTLIGDCLANPGHGFASARNFAGYGQSDDNVVMISGEQYTDVAAPSFEKTGRAFGGAVFHSCGDWSDKIAAVKKIDGLRMVDGAFSAETDPCPNPAAPFAEQFANTGIIVNARIVGDLPTIEHTVRQLWRRGMKLVVVTYCSTPEEQARAYDLIHEICV
ncbi:MAG: uroporphyrinogen decarboxylase family protein [Paludibacter sp.]|nr:uroporphyrinogen decarboxylase family protein [Paludibacter sp.]